VTEHVVVIGGGPAGLTAADLLTRAGVKATVLEADPEYVGGISRTAKYKGYRFDIGGHRFFSKSAEVEDYWTDLLGDDLLIRPRTSRIYYDGKYFSYPLKPVEAFKTLGPVEATRCAASYGKARIRPNPDPQNFEEWVTNQFGERLYSIFFKTYTEKVWGMPCSEISADWAAQRIKGLSLGSAVLSAIKPKKEGDEVVKTLIDSFRYPRLGPGMMWERAAERVEEQGGTVKLGQRVVGLEASEDEAGRWIVTAENASRERSTYVADDVISSMPMRSLMRALGGAPEPVTEAAEALRYRDFLIVALIVRGPDRFSDNWVYIHDSAVTVGRVQNFKSWSPEMVPDPDTNCYGLEYFCSRGDDVWEQDDESLIEMAKAELVELGMAEAGEIEDGHVVRQPKAYPVYDATYTENVAAVRSYLEDAYEGLHLIGRNGMHKYNNQDHAIMTAMLTVDNILAGTPLYDPWQVNEDAEYHESGSAGSEGASGLRLVPQRVEAPAPAGTR